MTPEQQQALAAHLDAIAAILYEDSRSVEMTDLESIELQVRHQMQQHVGPALGSFLSAKSLKPKPEKSAD
jgi:hypothetical protein